MKKITIELGSRIACNPILYYLLNFTWGILWTLIGYIVLLIFLPFGKIKRYDYTIYLEFKKQKEWGMAIGTVFFVGKNSSKQMIKHEFGHTVQNALFGPFMIFVIAIPSFIRYHYRNLIFTLNIKSKKQYDDIWFEGSATRIGSKHYVVRILY